MKLATLDTRHPELESSCDRLCDYEALYEGGEAIEARVARFIPQRPDEPKEVYDFRKRSFHYVNYTGFIVNFFVAALFGSRLDFHARGDGNESPELPEWFADFREDCDTEGTDFVDFLSERLTQALIKRRVWILVDFPKAAAPPETRADWRASGLDRGYLCPVDPERVLDWRYGPDRQLLWAIVHNESCDRDDPAATREIITETWTIYRRDGWERYAISYKKGQRPKPDEDAPLVDAGPSATPGVVPLVPLELKRGLWLLNHLASPQIEQLRSRNALSWSLARTCFAQRMFFLEKELGEEPVAGPGYGSVFGKDDKVEWDSPPSSAFSPQAEYGEKLKDEIFRIAGQMGLGTDNSKAAAVGRSGESKAADFSVTVSVLIKLGKPVKEVAQILLRLLALGRGETTKFRAEGLVEFDVANLEALLTGATTARTLAIKSPTFNRLLDTRVALALVPDASEEQRAKIAKEIEENTPDEIEPPSMPPPPPPGAKNGEPDGDEEGDDEETDGETEDAAE